MPKARIEPRGHDVTMTIERLGDDPSYGVPTYQAECADCSWRGLTYCDGDQTSGWRAAESDAEWHYATTLRKALKLRPVWPR